MESALNLLFVPISIWICREREKKKREGYKKKRNYAWRKMIVFHVTRFRSLRVSLDSFVFGGEKNTIHWRAEGWKKGRRESVKWRSQEEQGAITGSVRLESGKLGNATAGRGSPWKYIAYHGRREGRTIMKDNLPKMRVFLLILVVREAFHCDLLLNSK